MISNLEKYKKDLDNLIERGDGLLSALFYECFPDNFSAQLQQDLKDEKDKPENVSDSAKSLPNFSSEYQGWYSESLALIRQLLPERADNFCSYYNKPKTTRKDITVENYVIEDALIGLKLSSDICEGGKVFSSKVAALPRFEQQLSIVKSIKGRFESSLFDIKQLVQANLFDSELEAAKELNKKGFMRGAGAVADVVLENHLLQVCGNHKIAVRKRHLAINGLAQLLKDNNVIDTPTWRKIQHLADLRNLCSHKKEAVPKTEQIEDLIDGVSKVIKTLF